jgi:Asp-tRNA(Asn)/Glu-tRNA(Gln) amidotransferase A subunit family amidase
LAICKGGKIPAFLPPWQMANPPAPADSAPLETGQWAGYNGQQHPVSGKAAMSKPDSKRFGVNRRRVLKVLAGLGIGTAAFQRALAQQVAQQGAVTAEMLKQAEWISGIELSEEDRAATARRLQDTLRSFAALRRVEIGYDVAPAVSFTALPRPLPAAGVRRNQATTTEMSPPPLPSPQGGGKESKERAEALAFAPVTELAALMRTRQVTSIELTELALARLKKFNPLLKCVVTLLEEDVLKQARRADQEIAAGHYRGPLHGIPWGAKDLIAYPGYPTTWGATPFKEQKLNFKATVVRRLEEAGAVLVAKLSMGALAQGDQWYEGRTNNPWNPQEGSSGSSAGSASAVAAGAVPFALGSETIGSILSPSRQCSVTGLRPTFGRVSRQGCMTLAWSLDKIGPIARSVEDCALVLDAIHGADGIDQTAIDQPFVWPPRRDLRELRVGFVQPAEGAAEAPELAVLRDLGVRLVPFKLPEGLPVDALRIMLDAESACAFDELTRKGITEGLNLWPGSFRRSQFVPAIEYVRAARVRTMLMQSMDEAMQGIDLYLSTGANDLTLTNFTGHPQILVPFGNRPRGGRGRGRGRRGGEAAGGEAARGQGETRGPATPAAPQQPGGVTFTGRLFGESDLLAVAHAFQRATGDHLRRPPIEELVAAQAAAAEADK